MTDADAIIDVQWDGEDAVVIVLNGFVVTAIPHKYLGQVAPGLLEALHNSHGYETIDPEVCDLQPGDIIPALNVTVGKVIAYGDGITVWSDQGGQPFATFHDYHHHIKVLRKIS